MITVLAVLCIVAVLVLYGLSTAQRLDRLHARVDVAAAAFDAQLRRRCAEASAFASQPQLDRATVAVLSTAVANATAVAGLGHDRELVESGVTRAIGEAVDRFPAWSAEPSKAATDLHDEALRASFARTFYNDTVRDALTIRDRRVVRWFRLAGRAPHPAYFEMDDEELPIPRISAPTTDS